MLLYFSVQVPIVVINVQKTMQAEKRADQAERKAILVGEKNEKMRDEIQKIVSRNVPNVPPGMDTLTLLDILNEFIEHQKLKFASVMHIIFSVSYYYFKVNVFHLKA